MDASKSDWQLKFDRGSKFSRAWILPDGTAVQLGGQWHHIYLHTQLALRRRWRIRYAIGEAIRMMALRRGFARVNYDLEKRNLTFEARALAWPAIMPAAQEIVCNNYTRIDQIAVHLFNERLTDFDREVQIVAGLPPEELVQNMPFAPGAPQETTEFSPQATQGALLSGHALDGTRPTRRQP